VNASLASIVNQGAISAASGGSVSLFAPGIANQGTIVASLGKVNLGAGEQVTLNFQGNELINFAVDKSVLGEVLGPDGQPLEDSILNDGTISAEGGEVVLSARTAYDAIKSVVNNKGIIEAQTVENENGVIRLQGNDQGIVYNSGTLDVSGTDEGETGGEVEVTGEKVGLVHYSKIKASGRKGGGKVYVGGGFQGKNPSIKNGKITYVGKDAVIEADAIEEGNGGEVIVWADVTTRFYGGISATGGSLHGDGGFVEVSGKNYLDFRGFVDASAVNGKAGTLLLDPADINIVGTGTADPDLVDPGAGDPRLFQTAGNTSEILDTAIETLLDNGTSVTLNTSTEDGGGPYTGTNNGRITQSAQIDFAGGNGDVTLAYIADENIVVTSGNGFSITGSPVDLLNISLTATGNVEINAAVDTNGGTFSSSGVNFDNNVSGAGTIATGDGTVTLNHTGTIDIDATINAGSSGTIDITAGGNVAQTAAITASVLTISGTGDNTTTTNLNHASNSFNTLSITGSGSDIDVVNNSAGTLEISGISQTGTSNPILVVNTDAAITVSGGLTTNNGDLSIDAGSGTYTQNTDIDIGTGSGAITIIADGVTINSNTGNNAFTSTGAVTLRPSTATTTLGLGAGTFDISATEVAQFSSGITGAGSLVIGNAANTNAASTLTIGEAVNFGTIPTVTLNAASFSDGATTTRTLTAGTLNLAATNGDIGGSAANAAIDTTTTTLLGLTTDGNVYVDETTAFDTNKLNLSLNVGGGQTLWLEADSWATTGGVSIGTNDLVLRSETGGITGNGGVLTADTITLTNVAAGQNIGTSGSRVLVNASTLSATSSGAGDIGITESNGTALGHLDAGSGDIYFTANAAVTDGNAGTANFTGADLTLTVNNGAAGTNLDSLETTVTSYNTIQTTGVGGGIFLQESATLTIGDGGGAGTGVQTAGNGEIAIGLTAGDLTIDDDITANGAGNVTLTLSAADAAVITDTAGDDIASTSGDITITADRLTLANGTISSSGALLLQPNEPTESIGIGGAAGDFNLTVGEIALLSDGFASIAIGRGNSEGPIAINAITFNDPVTIQSPAVGGTIAVNGQITGSGNASITLDGPNATTTLNADIVTAGTDITITDNVVLGQGLTITLDTGAALAGNIILVLRAPPAAQLAVDRKT